MNISGQLRSSIDDNGKEHTNLSVLSAKMLKAREQMQNSEKEKEALEKETKPKGSVLGAIKKLKEKSTEKQEQKPIKGEMEL